MRVSENGLNLIMEFEGCRLTAYKDVVGIWTIGYGRTKDVCEGMTIDEDGAKQFLLEDVEWAEDAITREVHVALTQNQFDALVSLVYNIGINAFRNSTLLKLLNARRVFEAGQEFLKWDKAGGKRVEGLTRRRRAEKDLFLNSAMKTRLI